jgi:hypothetical protein
MTHNFLLQLVNDLESSSICTRESSSERDVKHFPVREGEDQLPKCRFISSVVVVLLFD